MVPKNAFQPKLRCYAINMAGTAFPVASYALQSGLTYALGARRKP